VLRPRAMAGALTGRFSSLLISVLLLKSFLYLQIYTQEVLTIMSVQMTHFDSLWVGYAYFLNISFQHACKEINVGVASLSTVL